MVYNLQSELKAIEQLIVKDVLQIEQTIRQDLGGIDTLLKSLEPRGDGGGQGFWGHSESTPGGGSDWNHSDSSFGGGFDTHFGGESPHFADSAPGGGEFGDDRHGAGPPGGFAGDSVSPHFIGGGDSASHGFGPSHGQGSFGSGGSPPVGGEDSSSMRFGRDSFGSGGSVHGAMGSDTTGALGGRFGGESMWSSSQTYDTQQGGGAPHHWSSGDSLVASGQSGSHEGHGFDSMVGGSDSQFGSDSTLGAGGSSHGVGGASHGSDSTAGSDHSEGHSSINMDQATGTTNIAFGDRSDVLHYKGADSQNIIFKG